MATVFDLNSVFSEEYQTVLHDDAKGKQEEFIILVQKEIERASFPGITVSVEEFITGGIFFNREVTKMVKVQAKTGAIGGLSIYFRAQTLGNVVIYTRLECIGVLFSFLNDITSKYERFAKIRKKIKNYAHYEEFVALVNLGEIVFQRCLAKIQLT